MSRCKTTRTENGNRAAGSSTAVDLSFAQLDYLLNDYVTIVAGDMVLPLGTYSERAAGWLNKIPDDPLVRDLLPGSGVGAQLRGAVPIGQSGQIAHLFHLWRQRTVVQLHQRHRERQRPRPRRQCG